MSKIGPNGNLVGRKKGEWTPGQYETSWVMGTFLALLFRRQKSTMASKFSREKKSLANLQDCVDYVRKNYKK